MKIVIVGCGRVGAAAAEAYDRSGHEVLVLDSSTAAFDRLPASFGGRAIRGDGTDKDVLKRAGAQRADVFLALTEGDNRNVMAAQLAIEALGASRVIAKINDPLRAEAYAELGIATLCRTGLMVDAIDRYLGFPPTALPGMLAPTGSHDDHHRAASDGAAGGTTTAAGTATTASVGAPATATSTSGSGTSAGPGAASPARPITNQEA